MAHLVPSAWVHMFSRRRLLAIVPHHGKPMCNELELTMNVTTLFLVWKGTDGDNTLWYTAPTDLSIPFPGQKVIPVGSGGTSVRPAMLAFGDSILMAYRAPDNSDILVSSYNFKESGRWNNVNQNVDGAGTSWAPSIAAIAGGAIMVWPGVGDDTRVWCSFYNPSQNYWEAQFLSTLVKGQIVPIQTGSAPAIVNYNGQLLMVWRGEGDNDNLYYAMSSDGLTWGPQAQIPGAASTMPPALTIFNGSVFMAFKGGTNDQSMYGSVFNGRWSRDVFSLGYMGTSHGPSVTAYQGELFMTWKGDVGDTNLYWARSADGANWTGQATITGTGSSIGPTVIVYTGPPTPYI